MGTVLMHERECRCLEPEPTWGNAWGHACKVRRGGHAAARAWALNLHKNTCKVRKGRHATARAWALDLRKNTCTGPAVANVCQHGRMGRCRMGRCRMGRYTNPTLCCAWGGARTGAPRCMGRCTHPAPCYVPSACGRASVPPDTHLIYQLLLDHVPNVLAEVPAQRLDDDPLSACIQHIAAPQGRPRPTWDAHPGPSSS